MNGQLSEQPLAELIREISARSLGGRLHLESERVKVVAYFERGKLAYAASNLRTLRLREYLRKAELVSENDLTRFNERAPDVELLKQLQVEKLLSPAIAEQVQTQQVADVLRLALLWTEGAWEFDPRSRLNEQLDLKVDTTSLLLEAGRRLTAEFVASRFLNRAEIITPLAEPLVNDNLLPAEGFLLSRLDRAMPLRDLFAISGLSEEETLGHLYSLSLAGLLQREGWKSAFRDQQPARPAVPQEKPAAAPTPPPAPEPEPTAVEETIDVDAFLERVRTARTHYDVLDVDREVSPQRLKTVYYQLARRYHPDRFRKVEESLLNQVESAFARITQAYDTLRDDGLRASYNSKLEARKKAEQLADSAPKPTTRAPQPEPAVDGAAEPVMSQAERAEMQFKEGFAALELGQKKVALGLFASAANAVPNEPRYRAFYGQLLAANENTRRAAEAELSAAIKLDPKNADYRVMLAELYRDLGFKLRAKGEAERAVAADPNNAKARDLLRALK